MNTRSIRLGLVRGCLAAAQRGSRILAMTAAIVFGGSSSAFACPVCFGAEETSMIDGARLGIMALLGVTIAVQGAFVAFFVYLWKQAKQNADIELDMEWAELQRGSRRS